MVHRIIKQLEVFFRDGFYCGKRRYFTVIVTRLIISIREFLIMRIERMPGRAVQNMFHQRKPMKSIIWFGQVFVKLGAISFGLFVGCLCLVFFCSVSFSLLLLS